MSFDIPYDPLNDAIDRIAGLQDGSAVHALRHQREKAAAATQASCTALLDPAVEGPPLTERLLVALYAARLAPAATLASHYQERLAAEDSDPQLAALVLSGSDAAIDALPASRLRALLVYTRMLSRSPVDGSRASLGALSAAGLSAPAVVTVSQLIAFVSFQARIISGLDALSALNDSEEATA